MHIKNINFKVIKVFEVYNQMGLFWNCVVGEWTLNKLHFITYIKDHTNYPLFQLASHFYSILNFIVKEQNQQEPLGTVSKRDQPSTSRWAPWEMSLRPWPTYQWAIRRQLVCDECWITISSELICFDGNERNIYRHVFCTRTCAYHRKRWLGFKVDEYIQLRLFRYV